MKLYIAFCLHYDLPVLQPDCKTLCAYIEFLTRTFKAPDSVRNYICGVRHLLKSLHMETAVLDSFEVHLMLRSLDLTMTHFRRPRTTVTPSMVYRLVQCCPQMGTDGLIMRTAILFSFFAFLRLSNLAPHSGTAFNPKRNICRGDILQQDPGLVIMLKWTKTCQDFKSINLIPLPKITGHCMCPVQAYLDMIYVYRVKNSNEPFLSGSGKNKVITTGWLTQKLGRLLRLAGYDDKTITWHDFRRGGAETCYRAGVAVSQIKQQGTWKSDSFWQYISQYALCEISSVPSALASAALQCT